MSEQDSIAEMAVTPPRPLPGKLLREAREAQGLTLGEVAGALKFSTRQIEALENDDFQQLQGKTFLRGFVRAYARLLKLSPDPLLDMLNDEASSPVQELIVVPPNMGETDPDPFYRKHQKKLVLAGILLLALGGIVWFADFEPAVEHRVQPVGVAVSSAESVAAQQAPVQEIAPAAVPQAADVAQPADASAALVFEFSDRSWLEVRNASGKILLTGEFPGGQKQTIADKPPYQIWIGKTSAVKLSRAGQAIDLQPYTREEVARFTLE